MSRRVLLVVAMACTAGCTMFDRDNRRTLNLLDANVAPSSTAGRVALLPVAIPVGCVALVADAVVVHPVTAIDDAWGDTVEALWSSRNESPLREVVFTPLAAVATPVVFAGDWLWRCLWPIDPREPDEPDAKAATRAGGGS